MFSEELEKILNNIGVLSQQEVEETISAITELVKKIVPEERNLTEINNDYLKNKGFNSCRSEMLKKD
jgi:hypothetical protein